MSKKLFAALFCVFSLALTPMLGFAAEEAADEDVRSVELPAPDKTGGAPLMQALAERKSTRSFSDEPLSKQDLSNILWAAWGVNRDNGNRTIPTAKNEQKVSVYFANASGIWIYDPNNNMIHKIVGEDFRAELSNAPLTIAYAVEEGKYGDFHVGSMYQNVGLYCASAGLGNVVRASGVDFLQSTLAPFLPSGFSIRITQSIGKVK